MFKASSVSCNLSYQQRKQVEENDQNFYCVLLQTFTFVYQVNRLGFVHIHNKQVNQFLAWISFMSLVFPYPASPSKTIALRSRPDF